jgi:TPP-dependent pyruvate/acetoin dehydrogenase alpha subunit
MFDAELYHDKSEVKQWKKRDPVPQLEKIISDRQLLVQSDIDELDNRVEEEVTRAVDFAEKGTWEPVDELSTFVYRNPIT